MADSRDWKLAHGMDGWTDGASVNPGMEFFQAAVVAVGPATSGTADRPNGIRASAQLPAYLPGVAQQLHV